MRNNWRKEDRNLRFLSIDSPPIWAQHFFFIWRCWYGFSEIINENKWLKQAARRLKKVQKVFVGYGAESHQWGIGLVLLCLDWRLSLLSLEGMVAGLDAGDTAFPSLGWWLFAQQWRIDVSVHAIRKISRFMVEKSSFENPTTVWSWINSLCSNYVLLHLGSSHVLWSRENSIFPSRLRDSPLGMMGLVNSQVSLGITTLIYLVSPLAKWLPLWLKTLALLTGCLLFSTRLKRPVRKL